jgi:hypothetical protein
MLNPDNETGRRLYKILEGVETERARRIASLCCGPVLALMFGVKAQLYLGLLHLDGMWKPLRLAVIVGAGLAGLLIGIRFGYVVVGLVFLAFFGWVGFEILSVIWHRI